MSRSVDSYDIVVIGGGSAGLTGATFAARLGAKVALIERHRIGGDCTWTGCVPSKALIHVAKQVHEARKATAFGLQVGSGPVEMRAVRDYVRGAVDVVYARERPEVLRAKGITVVEGAASFVDARTLHVGDAVLRAERFVIATGARPKASALEGIEAVPHDTYETIFDCDMLPRHLIVLGAGPIGVELGQAFRRLGSEVTLVGDELLPREGIAARAAIQRALEKEGVRWVRGRSGGVERVSGGVRLVLGSETLDGDRLLLALGRSPNVAGLSLRAATVHCDARGIQVDSYLRTSASHIFAAGDVVGGPQFTHLAGFQGFQAVRNALLPGSDRGTPSVLPRVTFTDPEVASVGLTEAEARERSAEGIKLHRRALEATDRAVCDGETNGFIELVTQRGGKILGATMVAPRAGEMIAPVCVAIHKGLTLADLSGAVQAYPSYAMLLQELGFEVAVEDFATSRLGAAARALGRWLR